MYGDSALSKNLGTIFHCLLGLKPTDEFGDILETLGMHRTKAHFPAGLQAIHYGAVLKLQRADFRRKVKQELGSFGPRVSDSLGHLHL